jgi:plasmid stabilization system protein ParE
MEVFWTDTALAHLDAIYVYIARDSERYAIRTVDRITRKSIRIAEHPLSGRAVPEISMGQIREVIEGPYRVVYHVRPDRVEVLAVIHGAQDFPWHEVAGVH